MTNNDTDSRVLSDLLDDEPTDELPALPDTGRSETQRPDRPALAPERVADTQRLENEIRQLQIKWQEVEQTLAQRDQAIRRLQGELDARSAAIEALHDSLKSAEQQIEALTTENHALKDSVHAGKLERRELRNALEMADAALAQLRADAQSRTRESDSKDRSGLQLKTLQNALTEARQKIQDLEIYIDGSNRERRRLRARKNRLSAEVASLQKAATAQERELEKRDRQIARLQRELERCKPYADMAAANDGRTSPSDMAPECAPVSQAAPDTDAATQVLPDIDLDGQGRQVTRLMIAIDQDRAVKYPLYKQEMTIGRAPDSDIQVQRQYISRHHARLLNDEHHTFIEDLGSRNGVCVNALRIRQRQRLKNGDLVDIGKSQFQFVDLMEPLSGPGNA
ncbi:MAG TPA: FHA domain-containing protein [Chromatiales bacterium]|nr:FHA domain-containing protein [Chromatiales bacterium]